MSISLRQSDRHGCDRMEVALKNIYAISTYHQSCLVFEYHSRQGGLDTKLCDAKGYQ